jgi:hypothetical protein
MFPLPHKALNKPRISKKQAGNTVMTSSPYKINISLFVPDPDKRKPRSPLTAAMIIANVDAQAKKIMSHTSVESCHGGRTGKWIIAASAMSITPLAVPPAWTKCQAGSLFFLSIAL